MKVTLPEFERAGVMVVGMMLDRYWYGPTSRISRKHRYRSVKVDTIEERPAARANVAMNIAFWARIRVWWASPHRRCGACAEQVAGGREREVISCFCSDAPGSLPSCACCRVNPAADPGLDFEEGFEGGS